MKLEKIKAKGVNHLYRHPSSGIIYYRRYHQGAEVTRSTKTLKIEEAKRFVEALAGGKPKSKTQRLTVPELFDRWIKKKETLNKRPNTITSIRATQKHIEFVSPSMFPNEINDDWWLGEFIPVLREQKANRKFFNDWKWIKAFLKDLKESGIITEIPRLTKPEESVSPGKVFSDSQVEDLLNFAQNPDIHLAILMAVTMGMRRLEIFDLRVSRVDEKKQVIHLTAEDTKTKKPRSFAVSPDVWPLLVKRLHTGSEWVFPSETKPGKPIHKDGFKTAWSNLKKICGIKGRFHDLRHTFLTKAFKAPGANPALICHYAGLSLKVAQKVYLHFDEDDTRQVAGLVTFSDSGKIRVKEAQV